MDGIRQGLAAALSAALLSFAASADAESLTVKMLPGEKWWGLCNNFGREMPFTEKTGFECDLRKDNYGHQSLSFLCSDRGRAIWCAEPVGVKIADGTIALESDKGEITLRGNAGRNLAEAYRYASRTWFPPTGEEPELLYFSAPQYNTWIELTYHQNEKDILAYAKSMLDHGLPPGIFMIDDTWQHGYGEWHFDRDRFDDPKGMIDKLHAMGFKVILWMCPFVSMDTPAYRRIAWGKNPDDVKGYPAKGGFLVSSRGKGPYGQPPSAPINWWNGTSALLDFTHPNAVSWFDEQLERLVKEYGADGFKFDGGGVHFYAGCVGLEGSSPKTFAYDDSASPAAQSARYGDFALKYKGSEYRNVFGFAGKPVIMRLHDKRHRWDALQRLVPDMLAAGFVGCPFICPDMIGGGEWNAFLPGSPFEPELFIRSAQIHALCPMMQISASPWRVLSPEHQKIFSQVAALRQRFAPRFVELAKESAKTGEPMMRNLEYCFPGNGYAEVRDEFMMGDKLLVAPVMEKGANSRKVVLPPGKWKSDDGQVYDGPATIEVPASLERLPYFEKIPGLTAAGGLDDVPWIGDGQPERNGADWYDEDPAPEFMAEFVLPEGVTETKVHFACAGFGWFRVGGNGGALPDPSGLLHWSVYDKTVYSTVKTLKVCPVLNGNALMTGFDLEPYPATNRVHVRLGNGFYNLPPLRFWGALCFREALAHGRPCFKLSIDGVDKPLEWKWRKTDIVRNSVYLGVEIDATRFNGTVYDPQGQERAGELRWKPAAVVKGPKGKIVEWPRGNPRTASCFGTDVGKSRWLREGEVQVVDFGTNASGIPGFSFRDEARGTRIEVIYGERLNADGLVNPLTQTAGQIKRSGIGGPGAPDLACQRDVYICRGPLELPPLTVTTGDVRAEGFWSSFTWHIFRYAEIRGAKNLLGERGAWRRTVSMLPMPKPFKADDPKLDALHEVCVRTFRSNLIGGVQSDCPGRERLGYGGDIVATYEAYMMNWDMREIYLKILRDFADEAEDDGWITETAPYVGIADRGFGGRSGPISWSLAVPELMDSILRHYDDKRALDFYPVCARYVRLVAEKCPDGLVPNCIGDHEALERAPDGCTATAHWHRFVELTAKFAKMLGRTDDEKEFTALAEKIRAAFVATYVKDGIVANGTQSAQAIGLYLGLVPGDQVAAAEKRLVAAVEEKDCGPTTGIFSTRYMLMYLSEHGRGDLARKIVLHKGFPGWMHMIERGATTLWETWKESDNVYSNCHPMFGSVDEWILKYAH